MAVAVVVDDETGAYLGERAYCLACDWWALCRTRADAELLSDMHVTMHSRADAEATLSGRHTQGLLPDAHRAAMAPENRRRARGTTRAPRRRR